MFVGREREMNSLQELYDKDGFAMTVVYGRRRIGKSTLLREFVKDKRNIFYTATKVGGARNQEIFADCAVSVLEPELADMTFTSIEAVFDFITRKLSEEKLVIVIDELSYWADGDEALLSVLQKYIDTVWSEKNLMMILCGSSLSFMEDKVLSEKSPLFGRRDSQIRLEPFNYREASLFVPNYSAEDKAICYGITGGVAKYLSLIDGRKSIDYNIKKLFFRTDGYLYDETTNLLVQEFSDVTLVNNIIEQIASGENTLNTIAAKVREKEQKVLYSLDKLIEVGLVERKKCITEEKNKKKTMYILKDYMFQFWYRFIPKAASIIELGKGDIYYEKTVKPKLHLYMGSVFEEMCRYYTLEQGVQGRFGCFLTRTGTWWGKETVPGDDGENIQQSADIDVVGISDVDCCAVVGECKFKNEPVDKSVYDTLVRRTAIIAGKYNVVKRIIFSLNGFTEWFDTMCDGATELVTLEEMYGDE
jgi:hypothetical protein